MKTIKTNKLGGVQGDVPILRIEKMPKGAKPTARRIVALGETTGHHHEIVGEVQCFDATHNLFKGIVVVVAEDKPAHLVHNSGGEHYTIEMAPGLHFIPTQIQQVEYDGANERRVLD